MRLKSAWMIVLALEFVPPAVYAAGDYWVVLGSFSRTGNIEAEKVRAASLGQPVVVAEVATARGPMQRLMAGPFEDRFAAQALSSTARSQGYPDAWLVRMDDIPASAPVSPAADPDPATFAPVAGIPPAADPVLNPDTATFDYAPLPAITPESDRQQQDSTRDLLKASEEEVPDKAPPGYNLNRLRRDA